MSKWNKHVSNTRFEMIGAQRDKVKNPVPVNKTIIHVTGPQRLNRTPFQEGLAPLRKKVG